MIHLFAGDPNDFALEFLIVLFMETKVNQTVHTHIPLLLTLAPSRDTSSEDAELMGIMGRGGGSRGVQSVVKVKLIKNNITI